MSKKLIIIGASGHGKVIADIARLNGYETIVFLDADASKTHCGIYPVVGNDDCADRIDGDIIVAIGNADVRKRIMESIDEARIPVLIHPNAVISPSVKIDKGTVVMAGAVINADAIVGKGCIVNTCSSIDHDCIISDYVHISVGAHIAGTVCIGEKTWVGAGAIVSNNINITGNCMIGAGACVVNNIAAPGTYVGIPARKRSI